MKAYVKGFLYGLLVVGVLTTTFYSLEKKGFFNLKILDVTWKNEKAYMKSPAFENLQNRAQKQMQKYVGTSLVYLPATKVLAEIKAMPWVQDVEIHRELPQALKIEIQAKPWVALVLDGKRFYPVTDQADLLEGISLAKAPDLPILKLDHKNFSEPKRKSMVDVLASLPQEGRLSKKTLVEMGFDKEGFYLVLSPNYNQVRLGDEDLNLRIARVEKVLEYLDNEQMNSRVINANFSQKVVVKLRKPR